MARWEFALETLSLLISYALFGAPATAVTLSMILVISVLLGGAGACIGSASIVWGIIFGLAFVGAPSMLSAILAPPVVRRLGGELEWRSSAFISFHGAIFTGFFLLLGMGFSGGDIPVTTRLMALCYVLLASYQYAVYFSITGVGPIRLVLPSGVQFTSGMLILLAYAGWINSVTILLTIKVMVSVIALLAVNYLVIHSMNHASEDGLGITLLEFVGFFLELIYDRPLPLSSMFKDGGVVDDIGLDVLSLRGRGGSKALLIASGVHPGPVRGSGSYDLPSKLKKNMEDFGLVMLAHGASTHGQDPYGDMSSDVNGAIIESLDGVAYSGAASDPIRASAGDARVIAQRFGDTVVLCSTFAPFPTDDVDPALGDRIRAAGVEKGLNVVYIDGHNSHGERGHVDSGTKRGDDLVSACRKAIEALVDVPLKPLRMGAASRGSAALLMIDTGIKTAYVFMDSNNALPEAREYILKLLGNHADVVELMTSDSHENIDLMHIHRPLTLNDVRDMGPTILALAAEAAESLDDAEAGFAHASLKMKILGTELVRATKELGKETLRHVWLVYVPMIVLADLAVIIIFMGML